ncbi:TPA: glycosyltransferase family 2 protein [Enterococcus faecium]|uniref:glycosyltransferase family 2 protein n=1 Tax=Enterococcus TaxID=1350 RepID=UPI000664ED65|nr:MULTISPECIES: glycosyltransferase family 2 protein [Enterococcus]EGP4821083.1 glycosyltransferase family 2 protein [Enterococcus faecium]EME3501516.1 glycosyltransferase family 2 protein [Enterococcus faecium]EME5453106.1 glycosyltransferase family 2 protein [Enterococcus faecium]PEQ19858.1 glycosyltransferase family 2 protein [Enterococcus faecium]HBE7968128.1 glycosyltransferase family 2 protein [Enterococcus faecium]
MSTTAIVILNWNGATDTIECIKSLVSNEHSFFSIFVLDNASNNKDTDKLEKWILNYSSERYICSVSEFEQCSNFMLKGITLVKGEKNLGFAKGNNLILKKIYHSFDYCILLNNDTVVTDNALTNMTVVFDKNPKVMVATCNIRYYSNPDKLWNAGGKFTFYGDRKYFSSKQIDSNIKNGNMIISAPFVTGCVLMIRQSIFSDVGFLSEDFFFGEEDFNYCMRLRKKKIQTVSILDSIVYHKISSSISKAVSGEILLRKAILHFTNRTINQKNFMSKARWQIWRYAYLSAIWFNIYKQTKNRNKAQYVYNKVKEYSDLYSGVNYDLFREINNLTFEKVGVS